MFGVVETFTVLGGIAAIVSAYKQAGGHFRFWKSKKQKAKVGGEGAALENSLDHVPHDLVRRYGEGSRCLGSTFADGDDIARQSMWKTLLSFHKTLLECLQVAVSGDHEPDLGHLLCISESTGRETNSILKDLYQRVLQAKGIPRDLSSPHLPSEPRQAVHNMFWEDQKGGPSDLRSVISRNSSMRSFRPAYTSEDVLQANLERLAQYSVQTAPSTSMNSIPSRNTSVRPPASANVLRRNMVTLLG